jgi:hypothetical protein
MISASVEAEIVVEVLLGERGDPGRTADDTVEELVEVVPAPRRRGADRVGVQRILLRVHLEELVVAGDDDDVAVMRAHVGDGTALRRQRHDSRFTPRRTSG